MVSRVHAQIKRATNSVMNDRVIPEIQKIAINLRLREKKIETGKSTSHQGPSDIPNVINIIFTKYSAFDIMVELDLGPYYMKPTLYT